MAYFSNGTEGMNYESAVCGHCVHVERPGPNENEPAGCPVWDLHLLLNYDAVGKEPDETAALVLETLIPTAGLYNGLCTMFHALNPESAELVKAWAERVDAVAQADGGFLVPETIAAELNEKMRVQDLKLFAAVERHADDDEGDK